MSRSGHHSRSSRGHRDDRDRHGPSGALFAAAMGRRRSRHDDDDDDDEREEGELVEAPRPPPPPSSSSSYASRSGTGRRRSRSRSQDRALRRSGGEDRHRSQRRRTSDHGDRSRNRSSGYERRRSRDREDGVRRSSGGGRHEAPSSSSSSSTSSRPMEEGDRGDDDEAYRARVLEQLKAQEANAADTEAKRLEAARLRREAIKAKYAAMKQQAKATPAAAPASAASPTAATTTPNNNTTTAITKAAMPIQSTAGAGGGGDDNDDDDNSSDDEATLQRLTGDAGDGGNAGKGLAIEKPTFDMFSDSPVPVEESSGADGGGGVLANNEIQTDLDGYSNITAGQLMGGRYKVYGEAGKGVFSVVMLARDLARGSGVKVGTEADSTASEATAAAAGATATAAAAAAAAGATAGAGAAASEGGNRVLVVDPTADDASAPTVALKVTRLNDSMIRAGKKEADILRRLAADDPKDRRCILRLLDTFEDRGFFVVVLEPMSQNLRRLLNMFGKNKGINLDVIRLYAHRVLCAMHWMKRHGVIHTDLKLDNVLVDESKSRVKLADFGSSLNASEVREVVDVCPLWYRPPEVLLRHSLSYGVDMWCFGCMLYELATGRVLFQGSSPNQVLALQLRTMGMVPNRFLKHCKERDTYFDGDSRFLEDVPDKVAARTYVRPVHLSEKPERPLAGLVRRAFDMKQATVRLRVNQLLDLLSQCLTINPDKRIDPRRALKHALFQQQ